MLAMWSEASAPASHRLAARPRAETLPPADAISQRGFTGDPAQIDNETLIFSCRGVADGGVIAARLNAFFAIQVNSPAMGMVNFSCCVGAARKPRAPGVIQSVAPPPRCAAVRMEVGADARL
jgi:hypothetical protein